MKEFSRMSADNSRCRRAFPSIHQCLISLIVAASMIMNFTQVNAFEAQHESKQLMVLGNKLVYADDQTQKVRLVGVNIPSLDWGMGERVRESVMLTLETWGGNLIRLPLDPNYWLTGYQNNAGNIEKYKEIVREVVEAAKVRGKYVVMDCHTYIGVDQLVMDFWMNVAQDPYYKNNPTVLFNLVNEPHSTNWEVWRNGGVHNSKTYIGHQPLVQAIRAQGANNVLVAGGLDYAFDLRGIAGESSDGIDYSLVDTLEGYGIVYDSHIYPMKGNGSTTVWDDRVGGVRKIAPVIIGEFGWDSADSTVVPSTVTAIYNGWMPMLLDWMDNVDEQYDEPVHWTAWNLHPGSTPRLIKDWSFMPTYYHGDYVKNRLLSYSIPAAMRDNVYELDGTVTITSSTTGYATLDISPIYMLKGLESMSFTVKNAWYNPTVFEVGIEEADGEVYTKEFQNIAAGVHNLSLNLSELVRRGNNINNMEDSAGDGQFTGAVSRIYFKSGNGANHTLANIVITTKAVPMYAAPPKAETREPELHPGAPLAAAEQELDLVIGFEGDEMTKINDSPGTGSAESTLESSISEDEGIDGSKALKVVNQRGNDAKDFGSTSWSFGDVQGLENARYLSFWVKNLGNTGTVDITFLNSDNTENGNSHTVTGIFQNNPNWQRVAASLAYMNVDPSGIAGIRITPRTPSKKDAAINGEILIDNLALTSHVPDYDGEDEQEEPFEFLIDFDAESLNVTKYDGPEGSKMTVSVASGAYEGKGVKITFNRTDAADWGGTAYMKLKTFPADLPKARYISFWMKTDIVGNAFGMRLVNAAGGGSYSSLNVTTAEGEQSIWKKYSYQLSDLDATSIGDLTELQVYPSPKGSGEIWLDNISFTADPPTDQDGNPQSGEIFSDFETDVFTWGYINGSKSDPNDTMSGQVVDLDGNKAYKIQYNRPAGARGKAAEIAFPSVASRVNRLYLTFDIKGKIGDRFSMNLVDAMGCDARHDEIVINGNGWRRITLPVDQYSLNGPAQLASRIVGLRLYNNLQNHSGEVYIDNLGFVDQMPEPIVPDVFDLVKDQMVLQSGDPIAGDTELNDVVCELEFVNTTDEEIPLTIIFVLHNTQTGAMVDLAMPQSAVIAPAEEGTIPISVELNNLGGIKLEDGYKLSRYIFWDFDKLQTIF